MIRIWNQALLTHNTNKDTKNCHSNVWRFGESYYLYNNNLYCHIITYINYTFFWFTACCNSCETMNVCPLCYTGSNKKLASITPYNPENESNFTFYYLIRMLESLVWPSSNFVSRSYHGNKHMWYEMLITISCTVRFQREKIFI